MLKFEFVQTSEFSKPRYNVIFCDEIDEYEIGYLHYSGGNWHYLDYQERGSPAHLMIEIGEKMEELDRSVESQLFLGRF